MGEPKQNPSTKDMVNMRKTVGVTMLLIVAIHGMGPIVFNNFKRQYASEIKTSNCLLLEAICRALIFC